MPTVEQLLNIINGLRSDIASLRGDAAAGQLEERDVTYWCDATISNLDDDLADIGVQHAA